MPWMMPTAIATGMLGSAAIGAFGGGGGSVSQQPMVTRQQSDAMDELLAYGKSGSSPWGYDFTKGYSGPIGNYSMTPLEGQGQGMLSSMLATGNPAIFNSGTNYLSNFLKSDASAYDPNNDGGVYSGLTGGIDRNAALAQDASKRGAAYQGNLYSTSASRNIGDINVQAANQKSNILAQLYQNFANQKLQREGMQNQAAGSAVNAGAQENQMSLAGIAASQTYGALQRTLNDQKAKDAYSAWLTQRQSELQPVSALSNLAGSNVNYGVQSVPVQSPWNQLLNTLTTTGSYLLARNGIPQSTSSTGGYTPTPVVGPTQGPDMEWMSQYQFGR